MSELLYVESARDEQVTLYEVSLHFASLNNEQKKRTMIAMTTPMKLAELWPGREGKIITTTFFPKVDHSRSNASFHFAQRVDDVDRDVLSRQSSRLSVGADGRSANKRSSRRINESLHSFHFWLIRLYPSTLERSNKRRRGVRPVDLLSSAHGMRVTCAQLPHAIEMGALSRVSHMLRRCSCLLPRRFPHSASTRPQTSQIRRRLFTR